MIDAPNTHCMSVARAVACRMLALGRDPDLEPGLSMRQLLETIESDVLGMNRLMGTYERK